VEDGQPLGVAFEQGSWQREVGVGNAEAEMYGLIEVMDNNPVVCADYFSVPGAAATLALIAIAPLAQAGLIAETPVLMLNFADDGVEVANALGRVGWNNGIAVHTEPLDLGSVLAATAMVSILTPTDLADIDALYEEQFGRSFYIRRDESSTWGPELVQEKPNAVYRLTIAVDSPQSLLTIRVLADREGKCGACQIVHAMNVMCGIEESVGIN